MKKKLAAVLAGVMVLTMGMATVFASVSPTTSDDGKASADAVSETGSVDGLGSVDVGAVTENEDGTYSIAVDSADAEELGLVEGQTYYLYIDGVAVAATYTDGSFVVDTTDTDLVLEDGADISYEVYADSEDESSEEDTSTEEPSEGTTASTESGSTTGDGTTTSGDTTGTTSTGSSPKTGAAAALPLLAVAALAGVVVCGKKVKFYE